MLVHEWTKVKIKEVKMTSHEKQKSYKQEIKGLGSMIVQNGLYGTLAFYNVKKEKKEFEEVAKVIVKQLKDLASTYLNIKDFDQFPPLENEKYLRAQELAIEAVSWLRRYADILIKEEEEEKNDNS